MRKITAYLRFDGFERKMKIQEFKQKIVIPITLPLTISYLQEVFTPDSPNKHQRLVFEWHKQLTKFTHEYCLKEII